MYCTIVVTVYYNFCRHHEGEAELSVCEMDGMGYDVRTQDLTFCVLLAEDSGGFKAYGRSLSPRYINSPLVPATTDCCDQNRW